MTNLDSAMSYVLSNEGGVEENSNDPGGTTNFGISLRTYKELEYPQATIDDIKNMSMYTATKFYQKHFWLDRYDQVISKNICNYIFDMAVNMGPANAHKVAQRAVWSLSCEPNDLPDDGIFGDNTLHYVNYWSNNLLAPLRAERANYYKIIILKNSQLKDFESGWMKRTYK